MYVLYPFFLSFSFNYKYRKKKKKKLLNRLLKTFWKVMVLSYPEYAGISYVRRQRLEQIADIRYA